ncbi:hypothetical protein [Nocardia wallacei]|uniref:Uncharacterized protein n=1 Tax=Nocardia wallacei TaxID=480035 RepID=A0A7G1KX58_9NOCA|nr:hypothetical protein [Nocardia wallacei]BCK58783.1 hypothetical protein NWFMUON74_65550 [Nocardia wallacei]
MTYLLALIAVVAVAVLCWKAFGPERSRRLGAGPAQRNRIIGPDDDPDFLWRISRPHHDGDPGNDR